MDSKYTLLSSNSSKRIICDKFNLGGDIVAVGGKVAMMPISLGTSDFLVHHIHIYNPRNCINSIKRCVICCSRLIPDKANLGFRFCDGPRGGTVKLQLGTIFF
jgi:photosystem I P700 chlorophyll a apoprotein A1